MASTKELFGDNVGTRSIFYSVVPSGREERQRLFGKNVGGKSIFDRIVPSGEAIPHTNPPFSSEAFFRLDARQLENRTPEALAAIDPLLMDILIKNDGRTAFQTRDFSDLSLLHRFALTVAAVEAEMTGRYLGLSVTQTEHVRNALNTVAESAQARFFKHDGTLMTSGDSGFGEAKSAAGAIAVGALPSIVSGIIPLGREAVLNIVRVSSFADEAAVTARYYLGEDADVATRLSEILAGNPAQTVHMLECLVPRTDYFYPKISFKILFPSITGRSVESTARQVVVLLSNQVARTTWQAGQAPRAIAEGRMSRATESPTGEYGSYINRESMIYTARFTELVGFANQPIALEDLEEEVINAMEDGITETGDAKHRAQEIRRLVLSNIDQVKNKVLEEAVKEVRRTQGEEAAKAYELQGHAELFTDAYQFTLAAGTELRDSEIDYTEVKHYGTTFVAFKDLFELKNHLPK